MERSVSPAKWPRIAFWVGVVLCTAPFWGLVGTLTGMVSAFDSLSTSSDADAQALAGDISMALWSTFASFGIFIVGAVLLVVGILARRRGPSAARPNHA